MLTLGGAVDNFGPLCCPPMPKEEKRRLLGASPPPARGLRPPRTAKALPPPGIPIMSRIRRHAFVCLGYAAPTAPLPPAPPQHPPLPMALQTRQAERWRSQREDTIRR